MKGTIVFAIWLLSIPILGRNIARNPSQEYVVLMKGNISPGPRVADVLHEINLYVEHPDVRYVYNNSGFQGFAATIRSRDYVELLKSMNGILSVESVKTSEAAIPYEIVERRNVRWGLERISSRESRPMDPYQAHYTYRYNSVLGAIEPGARSDIYIMDSGINTRHVVFGTRASWLWSFDGTYDDTDGHGTGMASIAGGRWVGVASGANIWSVKYSDLQTVGAAELIQGFNEIIRHYDLQFNAPSTPRGAVINMCTRWPHELTGVSGGILAESVLDRGIHLVVAAGNQGLDACGLLPGSLAGTHGNIINVGSIDSTGRVPPRSNFGPCVDVFAPGEDIYTAAAYDQQAMHVIGGTSAAAPFVAGIVAYLMALEPALQRDIVGMKSRLRALAQRLPTGELVANNGVWEDVLAELYRNADDAMDRGDPLSLEDIAPTNYQEDPDVGADEVWSDESGDEYLLNVPVTADSADASDASGAR